MKLTLAEPKYLKDSIAILSEIVNEAKFKVNKEGIELIAMDPANVAMVVYKLLSSNFTEYTLKEDRILGVSLEHLRPILRRAGSTDMITLELKDDSKLKIQLRGTSTRTFHIPLIDIEDNEQKIPQLTFTTKIVTGSSGLTQAVEDAEIVSESVTFVAEAKKFSIVAEGSMSKAEIEIKEGDDTAIKMEENEKVKSKYSIEYLKKMMNGSKLAEKVQLEFSKDYPLKITYASVDKLSLSFILAPRVDND
jgi:proliferating cell nuclear antigen